MKNSELDHTLAVLAQKLGTTVDHLWGVLVHQARVQGIIDLSFMGLGFFYSVWYCLYVMPRIGKWFDSEDESKIPLGIVSTIAFIFSVVGILMNLGGTITEFINPEYWALQQLGRWF